MHKFIFIHFIASFVLISNKMSLQKSKGRRRKKEKNHILAGQNIAGVSTYSDPLHTKAC